MNRVRWIPLLELRRCTDSAKVAKALLDEKACMDNMTDVHLSLDATRTTFNKQFKQVEGCPLKADVASIE